MRPLDPRELADREEWSADDLLDTFGELIADVKHCLSESSDVPDWIVTDLRTVKTEIRRRMHA